MKYVPKEITENVNISKRNPLKEFSGLVIGLCLIIFVTVTVIGFSADILITRIPVSWEKKLTNLVSNTVQTSKESVQDSSIQALFDSLVLNCDSLSLKPSLVIIEDEVVNAGALPGGVILLFTGLLEQAESENEIAFVLAHEIGHIQNRDHLRGLGKGVAVSLLAGLLNNSAGVLTDKIFAINLQRYSKQHEFEADQFGIDLLVDYYGHAGDAVSFFDRVSKDQALWTQFSSTHPLMVSRINALRERIREKNYSVDTAVPYSYNTAPRSVKGAK